MPSDVRSYRIAAILAGGKSRRMGNIDKAIFEVGGRRLIDIVIDRTEPQADELLLSANTDYGTGLDVIPDQPNRLAGPVAGLWAVAQWVDFHRPNRKGFFTVPVDAPLISDKLFDRMEEAGRSAIAKTKSSLHPTFGYWEIGSVLKVLENMPAGNTLSLKALSERVAAVSIEFEETRNFSNINSPNDAKNFEEMSR